ncbi:MAG: Ppx/GppA family phosphatase [Thermoleophilia bacterium]|nr:Ppx/GppA family phosphatase [Thermoleophilia bacterium]
MPSADPSPASPRRVAVIDIGTNSTRLLVADVVDGRVKEVERHSRVTGLGRGVDHSGQLSAEGIEAVCITVGEYIASIEQLGAITISVIATSAVRDAENGSAFAAELRERFDLSAEVIDGDEEARLTYLGCISERTGGENLMVVDIGGGSTEIIIGRGHEPDFHVSLQAGVVRHTERFLTSDPPDAGELEKLAGDIEKLIGGAIGDQDLGTIEAAVAVAGTPTSLAAINLELDPYDPLAVEGHRLPLTTIQWWLSRLASAPVAERKLFVGLHPDRAGAIVAGIVILIEVMRAFSLDEIEVSEHDILYGAAIQAAAQ